MNLKKALMPMLPKQVDPVLKAGQNIGDPQLSMKPGKSEALANTKLCCFFLFLLLAMYTVATYGSHHMGALPLHRCSTAAVGPVPSHILSVAGLHGQSQRVSQLTHDKR